VHFYEWERRGWGEGVLLPSDIMEFAMLLSERRLAGNSLKIASSHVPSKQPMRAHAVRGKDSIFITI